MSREILERRYRRLLACYPRAYRLKSAKISGHAGLRPEANRCRLG